jgi:uncharacterized protein YihD (DUF1040 family)
MKDLKRINTILKLIKWHWKKNPDFRLGQLLTFLMLKDNEDPNDHPDIFYFEDDDLLDILESARKEI